MEQVAKVEKVFALFDTRAEADEAVEELLSLGYEESSIGYVFKVSEREEPPVVEDDEGEPEEEDEFLVETIEIEGFANDEQNEYDFSVEDPEDERHQMAVEDLYVNREIAEIEEYPLEGDRPAPSTFVGAGHLGVVKVADIPDYGRLLGAGLFAEVVEALGGESTGATELAGAEAAIWAEWSDAFDEIPEWAQPFRQGLDEGAVLLITLTRPGEGAGLASVLDEAGASSTRNLML